MTPPWKTRSPESGDVIVSRRVMHHVPYDEAHNIHVDSDSDDEGVRNGTVPGNGSDAGETHPVKRKREPANRKGNIQKRRRMEGKSYRGKQKDVVINKKVIIQKYLERGHTQMECDAVHSARERRLKDQDVRVPAENIIHMKKARTKPTPLEVKCLDHAFFSDFSKLKLCRSPRPGTSSGDATVHELRAVKYNISGAVEYKLQHSDGWSPFPRRELRSLGNDSSVISRLHSTCLTVKEQKYRHLQQLKELIPKDFHSFHDSLKH
ncbi:hypothetical protein SRHO_G00104430 [Serrasalmus rhombeus]